MVVGGFFYDPSRPTAWPERCRVGGVNQNYKSSGGTLYHIQVEDLGPVVIVHCRRLDMTRTSLMTTWRQIQGRLK